MTASTERRARVLDAVRAAARLADPTDELGRAARAGLPQSTGLSPQNVELALGECLEHHPSAAELDDLLRAVPVAPRAHVLLSANVFVAAHRAIAIALAASERVFVRASRREPEMARLLHAAGAPFELVSALSPAPGDHVWAYGADATLSELARTLSPGVVLHAHGSGLGLVVIDAQRARPLPLLADAIARDVVPFDQRGCLSPRIVLVRGTSGYARALAEALFAALERWQLAVPVGRLSPAEAAEQTRYRASVEYAAELFASEHAAVSLDSVRLPALLVPPIGRNVHVVLAPELASSLAPIGPKVAALGIEGGPDLEDEVASLVPGARLSALGAMPRPRFDGPVDRRAERAP